APRADNRPASWRASPRHSVPRPPRSRPPPNPPPQGGGGRGGEEGRVGRGRWTRGSSLRLTGQGWLNIVGTGSRLRISVFALVVVCCAGVIAKPAAGQVYPSRPITVIVPVPPGGVADPIARILADHMSAQLG